MSATFTVTLQLVTPIFSGGAQPFTRWERRERRGPDGRVETILGRVIDQGKAELRASSLKGLLRYWYRAIDPAYRETEPLIFGSAGGDKRYGQAPFLLTLGSVSDIATWEETARPAQFQQGRKNGARYLGFPLETRGEDRRRRERWLDRRHAIAVTRPPVTVSHHLSRRAVQDPRVLRALHASWWLLCHVGGLGARSRRGFGTVALRGWKVSGAAPPTGCPPLPSMANDVDRWVQAFQSGLKALRTWYPGRPVADHAVIDSAARFVVVPLQTDRRRQPEWAGALDAAGRLLQDFRQLRGPDHPAVKQHLAFRSGVKLPALTSKELASAPQRAAFGLPLPFTSQTVKNAGGAHWKTAFEGTTHDRSGSRLWFRVVSIGGRWYAVIARLSGPLLAPNEAILDATYLDADEKPIASWPSPDDAALDTFYGEVARKSGARQVQGV